MSFCDLIQEQQQELDGSFGIYCSAERSPIRGKFYCFKCQLRSHYYQKLTIFRHYFGFWMHMHYGIYRLYCQLFYCIGKDCYRSQELLCNQQKKIHEFELIWFTFSISAFSLMIHSICGAKNSTQTHLMTTKRN